MSDVLVFRFFIPPQTHIRTTDSERWMFAEGVTEDYLKSFGMKKYLERIAKKSKNPGTPMNYYNRKKRVQKYWDYKRALKILADEQKFTMPIEGAFIRFFIPMPKSWSKKKKNEKCFTLHCDRFDLDNIGKAFFDSILEEDKHIADYRISKWWYSGRGHIEVTIGELPPR